MLESSPRGPARAPWRTGGTLSWPLIVAAGEEAGLVQLEGYASACWVIFNPQGQVIPASTYQLNIYAKGVGFSYLAASLILAGGASQILSVRSPCKAFDVRVQLLLGLASPPTWTPGNQPTVTAFAHGRE
jgi:hypothetical protein